MFRKLMIGVVAVAALTCSTVAFAQQSQFGTAAETKALLERAVPLVKADKTAAFAKFLSGADGFKDRDLYVFCWNNSDGIINAAQPAQMGKDVRTLVDATGDHFGERLFNSAKEGTITEVGYMFNRPGTTTPVQKESYVTKIGDQTCGVGYYK
jgi:signal transduction histidine kinase